ncbi:TRAP transporter substrate-binding protein [Gracilibacillus sp. YIM 98692]|uniref:TRAP transporter substrate-binding protein n=1 Tax=Gracilibacillus sp. YIM 98692 TaxID=2663532 RepID=UPI001969A3D8|nr:TRAP transporter substrate-binding protein [Gracilibacillus sp. YIM 98692]
MKKMLKLSVFIGLILLIVGCGNNQTSEQNEASASEAEEKEVYEMKLHHDLAADSPQHIGAEKFKEIVEEETDGQVEVKLFPSGQLGDDVEVAELIQNGSVESGIIPTAKLSTFDARMQLPDLPFIFPSREAAYEVLDGEVGKELLAGLEDIGLKGASFWESGFKQFTNNERIEEPSDFEGLKIRTMESPIVIKQFEALGANPVPISFAETYNSLQQNVVIGQENPLVSIVKMKFYEVQDYTILSNHGYLAYAFLLSKEWFEQLPSDIQTVILDASQEAAEFERSETMAQEEDFIKTIEDYGVEVYELTPEQSEMFQEQTRSVHDEFADEIGQDLLDKTYEIVESMNE